MSIEVSFPAINEGVKLPMRWYKRWQRRNHLRRVCKGDCKYKLLTIGMEMLPFQIYAEFTGPFIITWNILDENENIVGNPDTGLLSQYPLANGMTYFIYKSDFFDFVMPQGFYTSEIIISNSSGSVTWYSEEFYSIGLCSQGVSSVIDPTICDHTGYTFGPGSGSATEAPCSICGDSDPNPVILILPNVFPVNLGYYAVLITVSNMQPGAFINVDCGGGTQFQITTDGDYLRYVSSAVDVDLVLTSSANWTGCFNHIDVQSLSFENIFKCHMTLAWRNDCGMLGEIYYGDSFFSAALYLDPLVEIINAQPKYFVEGVENGEKDFTPTFQKRSTVYTMELGELPPYVIEALSEMVLHKYIKIIDEGTDGLVFSYIKQGTAAIKPDYAESGGCTALVTLTFELDDTTVTDGCCDDCLTPVPDQPSEISGQSDGVCHQIIVYSVTADPNALSYTWTVPEGGVINSGQGTNSIEVAWDVILTPQSLSVAANGECGSSTTRTLTIIGAPPEPGDITMSFTPPFCNGDFANFSIAAVPFANSYLWTVPVDATIDSGQGTTSIDVIWGAGDGTVTVEAINDCGSSTKDILVEIDPSC